MAHNTIVSSSARFVTNLFAERLPVWAHYHSLKHTATVVVGCRKIGINLGLKADDIEVITIAGWFHDTGYTKRVKDNERVGAAIAQTFLMRNNYSQSKIRKVIDCIMATKIPQRPRNILEKVICDADMASLGKKTFLTENELLRKEIVECENRNMDVSTWLRRTEPFLRTHRFHTTYGRTVLERGRQKNISIIQQLIREIEEQNERIAHGKKNPKEKQRHKMPHKAKDF